MAIPWAGPSASSIPQLPSNNRKISPPSSPSPTQWKIRNQKPHHWPVDPPGANLLPKKKLLRNSHSSNWASGSLYTPQKPPEMPRTPLYSFPHRRYNLLAGVILSSTLTQVGNNPTNRRDYKINSTLNFSKGSFIYDENVSGLTDSSIRGLIRYRMAILSACPRTPQTAAETQNQDPVVRKTGHR